MSRTDPVRSRFAACSLVLLVLGCPATTSCTLVLRSDANQCEIDTDCIGRGEGFEGTYCNQELHTCVSSLAYCNTNAECVQRNSGQAYTCHKDTHTCAPLTSALCSRIVQKPGDIENDDVVLFGAVSVGEASPAFIACDHSIALAHEDFQGIKFLPGAGGSERRPVAFVLCDWKGPWEDEDFDEVANHLTDNARVKGIIGPTPTTWVADLANVTIPKQTPLFSPASSGDELNDLPGRKDLLYRMVPSDSKRFARAAGIVGNYFEKKLREGRPPIVAEGEPIRVAVLKESTAHGANIANVYFDSLTFNGQSAADNAGDGNYKQFGYGDPQAADFSAVLAAAAADLIEFAPHVIGMATSGIGSEAAGVVVEKNWPEGVPRPFVFVDGGGMQTPVADLADQDPTMIQRWAFINDGPTFDDERYKKYKFHYDTDFGKDGAAIPSTLSAAAYDIAYLYFYAAASLRDAPLEPAAVGKAIRDLTDPSGLPIRVGPAALNTALEQLLQGNKIRFEGVMGDPTFDEAGDNINGSVVIFCIDLNADEQFVFSGLSFDADGNVVGESSCL